MAAVGEVYFLRCKLCNPPKDKFFVVAMLDPLKLFLINSEMTEFQQARPEFVVAQAPVLASQHGFLTHDSYIGCDWLHHEYDGPELAKVVAQRGKYRLVGQLSAPARQAVANALVGNVHIKNKFLRVLQGLWP
ncbi:hypothetical protein [Xanthomonas oryzae]|uniref:hypothetical protein n=1 Tax=Xanthomonas oryzae TaxID=347 RepID=UPI00036E2234|nr:hypothetical protein [Xanthomonas oryzae]